MKMDRWEKNNVISLTLLGSGILALMVGHLGHSFISVSILVFILGYFCNGVNPGCYALATAYYPTQMRATGVSWAAGMGRLGAITGSGLGALIMSQSWSMSQIFTFLCIPPLLGMIAVQAKRLHQHRLLPSAIA